MIVMPVVAKEVPAVVDLIAAALPIAADQVTVGLVAAQAARAAAVVIVSPVALVPQVLAAIHQVLAAVALRTIRQIRPVRVNRQVLLLPHIQRLHTHRRLLLTQHRARRGIVNQETQQLQPITIAHINHLAQEVLHLVQLAHII